MSVATSERMRGCGMSWAALTASPCRGGSLIEAGEARPVIGRVFDDR